ncbi:hypothetical protein JA9_004393 [Meyerozyma sp. JA9]|nr:hypothetical protein JA9_004393 [Meyerozyma sp. JA9]
MVSFSCEVCNDTVLKKKLDAHKQRCNGAYFTCIDCSVTFNGTDYRGHTSCISEAQKYEKGLYKAKKKPETKQEAKPEPKEPKQEPKQEKSEKSETSKSEKSKSEKSRAESSKSEFKKPEDKSDSFVSQKPQSLYKVIKKMEKKDKKHFLERIHVSKGDDGQLKVSVKY